MTRGIDPSPCPSFPVGSLLPLPGASKEAGADAEEGLSGPRAEPVDGCAVDERGELAAAGSEGLADRAHGQDQVQVVTDLTKMGKE